LKSYRKIGERVFDLFNAVFLSFITVITIYPFLYVLFASLSNSTDLARHKGLILFPLGFNVSAYEMVFKNPMILKGYGNTIFIVIVGVALNIVMTSIGAYFLSRKNVLLKKPVMALIVFTMFFSGGLIPFYFAVKNIGLTNTLWSAIIPFSINTFNLIIMRTSFMSIPDSLEESAKIEGAGDFWVLCKIIIPLSLPIIAVMVLYYGVEKWNGWFYASIFITKRELFPLQVILREILLQNDTSGMAIGTSMMDKEDVSESIKYATTMVATLPVLTIYPFVQKYFVKGVMIGALKE